MLFAVVQDAVLAVFVDDPEARVAEGETLQGNSGGLDASQQVDVNAGVPCYVVQRAVHCALRCIERLHGVQVYGHNMRLHLAMSSGQLCGYNIGGVGGRWQYIVGGPAFGELGDTLDATGTVLSLL